MTTRKIKDAKDLSINELIYFKGHAQATYLSDGRTVEEAIPTKFSDLENDQSLVNQFQLATINGQSLVNDGQDITIESSNIDTSSFATKETVMTDEIAVNADGFRTTNGEWFALPSTDSENNSDYCIATFDDIPTSTSDLTNDSGFITSADNIDSATKLQTTRYINGVGFDGTSNITNYVTCATAATAREKVVNPENFSLVTGAKLTVKFTYANRVSSPGLNVAGTGTKAIQYRGSYLQSSQYWTAGDVVDFVYDGSVWQVIGPINDNVGSDTKVNQTLTSTNSSYPLLFSYTANKSATSADAARFSTGLKYNPSTQSLLFPAATSGKSVNIGLGTKPSSSINGLVLYNAGGSQSDADFINICAADVFIRKADGSLGGRIFAELNGNASTATALETPRTINGVSFDGSSDIEIDTTHIGKEHNAVIYFKGPAKSGSFYEHEYHTIDGTLVKPKSLAGGMVYILYNENVVSQAIPLNHVLTGNFFPIKVSTILTSASGNINNWTDAYIKCGISSGSGPIIYSIHLTDTNRTDVSNINLDNCTLEGHVYGTF